MGFIEDPDQNEDFPQDPSDYESRGYQGLDTEARWIIEIFQNNEIPVANDYVEQLIQDLIDEGGINEFAQELAIYTDYYMTPEQFQGDALRANPFFSAADAIAYLEGIPGWEGFAGITWINGTWHVVIGDTL